jgi:transcriptional regulator with XRE-family HTH domain
VNETTWWAYVQTVAGDVQAKEIADRAGFDKSAVTRWKQGGNPDPLFAVKFARAFGRPVVEALAAGGLITPEEADMREVAVGVSDLTNEELLDELRERLDSPRPVAQLRRVGGAPQTEASHTTPFTGREAATRGNTQVDQERDNS